ncbi:MAG: 5'/3'-nucleotidase SurE [Candidatus Thermoplasmatota archaeon]|nr:5'/3'-nucleotidase SurE [Candidatus Thermoplasmatota archaeon]
MVDILLTNDDGYLSSGFLPLLEELQKEFSVVAITPDTERSWIGKAISSKNLLQLKKTRLHDIEIYTINGTPADCVQIGLFHLLDSFPKMVISGINQGVNVGHARILSSGTIGAAMEASIQGIQALASSIMIPEDMKKTLDLFDEKNYSLFTHAAQITAKLAFIMLDGVVDEDVDLFSVNCPFDATKESEIKITKPSKASYGNLFSEKDNGYILLPPLLENDNMNIDSDMNALFNGTISITPLNLDLCLTHCLKNIEQRITRSWKKR